MNRVNTVARKKSEMHMGLAIFVVGTSVSAHLTRMKRPLSESCVPVIDYILTKIGCGSLV